MTYFVNGFHLNLFRYSTCHKYEWALRVREREKERERNVDDDDEAEISNKKKRFVFDVSHTIHVPWPYTCSGLGV